MNAITLVTSMKIYISGPITGMPNGNAEAFEIATRQLEKAGYRVISPINNGRPGDAEWSLHMRADIIVMLGCDGVALLDGWRKSVGARIEMGLADYLDMPVGTVSHWLEVADKL